MLFNKNGFAMPFALFIMLVILVISVWANRDVLFSVSATVSQKKALSELYAEESAIRWVISYYLKTGSADNLSSSNPKKEINLSLPVGNEVVPVNIVIRFIDITTQCDFKSACCRRFEIRAQVPNSGQLVKIITIKSIPNPDQDEEAKNICVL